MSNNIEIFISHSSKDKYIASDLAELISIALNMDSDKIRCTSSIKNQLPGGVCLNDALRKEINECKVQIGIITYNALSSIFTIMEMGARWGINKILIPIIFEKEKAAILKKPLSDFNAIEVDGLAAIDKLMTDLSYHLGDYSFNKNQEYESKKKNFYNVAYTYMCRDIICDTPLKKLILSKMD